MKTQALNIALVLLVSGCIVALFTITPAAPPEREVAAFSTSLVGRAGRQLHNMRLAARALEGKAVAPGAVFSFNRTIGNTSADRGYVKAAAILDGEIVPQFGGGVCQVSSTLYNAALLAGCPIQERTRHIWPVRSVPAGLDAAVASGQFDLKFQNPLPAPLRIRSEVIGKRLVIRLLSTHPPTHHIKITREVPATFEATEVIEPDPTLKAGERRTVNVGQKGYRVRVYRSFYESGKEVKRELVSQDYYAPMNRVVRVGAGR